MSALPGITPQFVVVTRPQLKIFRPEIRTPIPNGFEAKIGDKLENPDLDFEILSTPAHIIQKNYSEDRRIYLVEVNSNYTDFSELTQSDLEKLKNEIKTLQKEENIKHLIISFYDCYSLNKLNLTITDPLKEAENNWDEKGIDYFVDMLWEARTQSRLNNKKLNIIHNEQTLHHNSSLKDLPAFVHANLGDAIRNGYQEKVNYKVDTTPRKNNIKPYIRTFMVCE